MGTLTTATVGYSNDHQAAVDGGFDIVAAGLWVRYGVNQATIERRRLADFDNGVYFVWRAMIEQPAIFYTMREAVEWAGRTSSDPERLHFVEPGEDDR